ncbi:helix-turn-helix domain-containing protein [Cellulomonas sp. P5_C5]
MRIRADETSGVLHPENLTRYAARWIAPDPAVHDVVDTYWHVRWHLDQDEVVDQTIVDLPAVTLTVETGDVPAHLVVTGLHRRAWRRRIAGSGDVFAVRLRPAGLAVLGSLRPRDLADTTTPLTAGVDDGLRTLLAGIAVARTPEDRARVADRLIAERLRAHPPPPSHLLANRVLDELRARAHRRTGTPLAEHLAVSERTIQRALSATIGIGPKQAARRIRLQEAARAVAVHGDEDLAAIAVQLGYADQAHLTSDFRASTGTTPGAYRRQLAALRQSGNAL